MSKVTLTDLANLQNETTAVNAINANNAAITAAMNNTLSRDGTAVNTMTDSLDMNSNQIINLPAAATDNSPLRLSDLNTFVGGGTITNIPSGGTTGQVLAKSSNANYAVAWTSESAELTAGTNIVLTGTTPTTISTSTTPTFTTVNTATIPTVVDTLVARTTADTLTNKTIDSAVFSGTSSGTYTFGGTPTLTTGVVSSTTLADTNTYSSKDNQFTLEATADTSKKMQFVLSGISPSTTRTQTVQNVNDTFVYRATTDTLTGKTLDTAGTGNHIQISGVDITRGQILGEASTTAATAGNIGEYIETVVASGSAVSLVTATGKDVATITLTAGDWDISGEISYITAATTSVTTALASISTTLNTVDFVTAGRVSGNFFAAAVPGAGNNAMNVPIGPVRVSISGSTTYHLVANATFTVAALSAWGFIRARRIR